MNGREEGWTRMLGSVELPSGIRIRYDERGPADARPLVLTHGFGVSLAMWRPQMGVLSQEYRLITWDARGHGGSSAPEGVESYSMEGLASDLRGLLEALGAVDGAVIGGMSFGGMIAAQYAVDYPDDVHALILSDTLTRDLSETPRPVSYGEPGLDGCRYASNTRADVTEALHALKTPVLVLAGTEDERIMAGLHRLTGLPRRRIVVLEGCSHGTSAQRPRDWSDEVLRFLRDVDAGAALGEDEVR